MRSQDPTSSQHRGIIKATFGNHSQTASGFSLFLSAHPKLNTEPHNMAQLNILQFPDPRLRTVAKPIKEVDNSIAKLAEDMFETMYEGDGIGLAATQVDIHKRIIVIDISNEKNDPLVLINPTIKRIINNEKKSYSEGCLSVPGIYEELERPSAVEICALGLDGKEFTLVAEDLLSVVIQHEMDHLEGILFIDYLSKLKRSMIIKKLSKLKSNTAIL